MSGAWRQRATTPTPTARHAPRWVPLTERGHAALQAALDARPAGSRNLLRPGGSYAQWRNGELRSGRDALHGAGVRGYHDARAAYACARYRDLTGHEAPAVAGERAAACDADRTGPHRHRGGTRP